MRKCPHGQPEPRAFGSPSETRALRDRTPDPRRTITETTHPDCHAAGSPATPPCARRAPAPALAARHRGARGGDARDRRGGRRGDRPGARRPRSRASALPLLLPSLAARSRAAASAQASADGRPAAAGHAPGDARRRARERARHERQPRPTSKAPSSAAASPSSERHSAADAGPDDTDRAAQQANAPAGHERVADRALRRHVRAGARPAGRRPLHRLPARARGHAAERLVRAATAAPSRARPALLAGEPTPQTLDSIVQPPCPEGAAGAACAPETAGALTAADEFLKATVPDDHRERRLPRTRPDRGHVRRGRQRHRDRPARRRVDRDAQLRSPRRACCCSRRSPTPARGRRRAFNPTSPKQSLARLLH